MIDITRRGGRAMKTRRAYCSACDRDVLIAYPEDRDYVDSQANIPDPEPVCFDIGVRCTGALCPLCAQPSVVMADRLQRLRLNES
jgi:hypothetical protein